YVVGDSYTGRFDKNDSFTNPVALPVHDALFSDLANGDLYELALSSGAVKISYTLTFPITISGINRLDEDLNALSSISLSSPIIVGHENPRNGIFQSSGNVLFFNDSEKTWYAIAIATGAVTNLGTTSSTNLYQNESWANWGVGEFDGTTYSVMYRDRSSANILKQSLPDGTTTIVGTFSDVSDMASFTVDPGTNRWYFHYESSGQFGGTSETLGYADAVFANTTMAGVYSFSCPVKTDVTVDPCIPTEASATTGISSVETLIVPNPNSGTFTISSSKAFAAGTPFVVYNSLGSVMTQSILQAGKTEVSLANLTSGIYYVKFTNEGNSQWLKFIVE
ncbi:MAG: T9SS type A sorting domain-containing protein, partial [Cytophagales bacterium]|nr:T9SS type A sorting domain-containing protein [Cytophagales bacterium]